MKASMAGDTVSVMGELNPFARIPASTDVIRQTANRQRRSRAFHGKPDCILSRLRGPELATLIGYWLTENSRRATCPNAAHKKTDPVSRVGME
jgi:hypothetical protein